MKDIASKLKKEQQNEEKAAKSIEDLKKQIASKNDALKKAEREEKEKKEKLEKIK